MKTPFDGRGTAAAVAAAVLFAIPAAARTATAGEVFARNREAVLATNTASAGEFVFCVGRALSEDGLGAAAGFGKARSLAWGRFDRHLFSLSEWPAGATPEECRTAWSRIRKTDEENVRGAEFVSETQPGPGRWLAVLAVPAAETCRLRPSRDALEKAIEEVRAERLDGGGAVSMPTNGVPAAAPSAEPRGRWEEDGVVANETMSEGQF